MSTRRVPYRRVLAVGLGLLAAAPVADGKITGYPKEYSAMPLARAMIHGRILRKAVFPILPPGATPAAVSDTKLAGFPRYGSKFAILSTGDARIAANKNTKPDSGSQSHGLAVRGARDVVMMRIDLRVPRHDNCLVFDFRFLSEEFPEFVNDQYNDSFVAELDRSTWRSRRNDPSLYAPRNFAVDRQGHPIHVNAVGDTTMRASSAKGTTYDGATRLLRASKPVSPGNHHLYLSIFDQGDRIYDSAVFLDNLRTTRAAKCRTGVVLSH